MEKYIIVAEEDIIAIADAIRDKLNSEDEYKISQMPAAIRSIGSQSSQNSGD